MLRILPRTREFTDVQRLMGVIFFAVLAVFSAQVKIPMEPVPFTMQPLIVLLAGMVLGARDGALALAAYVGMIALGFPFDANMKGTAALFSATGGYLIGFIVAAGMVGLLVEKSETRFWQRWLAGVVGIAVIYVFGITVLKNISGMTFEAAWVAGGAPFIGFDLLKAVIAAGLTEAGRALFLREYHPLS